MIIDMHAHYVAPSLIEEAARNGARYGVSIETLPSGLQQLTFTHSGERLRPFLPDLVSLDARAAYLAGAKVDVQIVSTWTDMVGDDLQPRQAQAWARVQNETLASDAKASGGRFAAMGTIALADVAGAVDELDYLAQTLGLRSIELGTNINGRDLDHPDFIPVWQKIADLDLLVFLHPPYKPVGLERANDFFLNNVISYPVDTTIAAARLIFSGLLDKFPSLRICLAHGGGFLPYQIGRLDRGFAAHPACSRLISKPPKDYLKSFYFDTLTHDDETLAFLSDLVGPDRLFYGSDYPFEMLDPVGPARLKAIRGLTPGSRNAILCDNARSAFGIASKDPTVRSSA